MTTIPETHKSNMLPLQQILDKKLSLIKQLDQVQVEARKTLDLACDCASVEILENIVNLLKLTEECWRSLNQESAEIAEIINRSVDSVEKQLLNKAIAHQRSELLNKAIACHNSEE